MISDPIEIELFRHLFTAIAEDMGIVLRKTSYSANIKERRDYSCAVYDDRGQTVAMGDHMPVHLGAMPQSVTAVRAAFDLQPGDVALVNDPFCGGTHLPDITAVSGVFIGSAKKPAFFVANRAHHADVGGMSPGSMPMAREIYQEGLRIPPVLLLKRGVIDRPLLNLMLANVRTPVEREGDLMAQIMSLRRGEYRLREAVKKYGLPRVRSRMGALQDYSERMMRAALRALPSGTYRFEDVLEGPPGAGPSRLPIRVAVTLQRDSALVDFSGSSLQIAGPVNANLAVTTAAVMYVFRCLVPDDIPFTSGVSRPVRIVAPRGSIVNAVAPAAMAAGNVETSQRIVDVVLGALALAAPERIPAASCGTMNNISFGGFQAGAPFAYYETIAGGMGASSFADGQSAVHTHMTNSWNTPVEAFEHQYPVRIECYRVRRGSGGTGRQHGGDGIVREFRFLAPAEITLLTDRRQIGPYGLAGGKSGKPGRNILLRKRVARILSAKTRFEAAPGDLVRIETPGAGAWGK